MGTHNPHHKIHGAEVRDAAHAKALRPPSGYRPSSPEVLAERIARPLHPDHHARLAAHRDGSAPLPASVDNSVHPSFDQGSSSTCTWHALIKAIQIICGWLGSMHVGYSLTGAREGEKLLLDDGRMPVDCLAVAAQQGVALYQGPTPDGRLSDVTDADDGDPNPNVCLPATDVEIAQAATRLVDLGQSSLDPADPDLEVKVQSCLAAKGVIYLGTLVGSQFQALGGLAIALPCPADDPDADGHALLVVGYWTLTEADVATFSAAGMTVAVGDTLYRVQNSWSETWDANGECWASAAWLRACGELHPLVPAKAA